MSTDTLVRKPTFIWWTLGIFFGYLAITLLAAILAQPPAPDEKLGGWHHKFEPVVQSLPGAGVWQWGLGLDAPADTANVQGYSKPQILGIVLAALMGCCFFMGRRNKDANDKDSATDHDERVRQRARNRMAVEGRR